MSKNIISYFCCVAVLASSVPTHAMLGEEREKTAAQRAIDKIPVPVHALQVAAEHLTGKKTFDFHKAIFAIKSVTHLQGFLNEFYSLKNPEKKYGFGTELRLFSTFVRKCNALGIRVFCGKFFNKDLQVALCRLQNVSISTLPVALDCVRTYNSKAIYTPLESGIDPNAVKSLWPAYRFFNPDPNLASAQSFEEFYRTFQEYQDVTQRFFKRCKTPSHRSLCDYLDRLDYSDRNDARKMRTHWNTCCKNTGTYVSFADFLSVAKQEFNVDKDPPFRYYTPSPYTQLADVLKDLPLEHTPSILGAFVPWVKKIESYKDPKVHPAFFRQTFLRNLLPWQELFESLRTAPVQGPEHINTFFGSHIEDVKSFIQSVDQCLYPYAVQEILDILDILKTADTQDLYPTVRQYIITYIAPLYRLPGVAGKPKLMEIFLEQLKTQIQTLYAEKHPLLPSRLSTTLAAPVETHAEADWWHDAAPVSQDTAYASDTTWENVHEATWVQPLYTSKLHLLADALERLTGTISKEVKVVTTNGPLPSWFMSPLTRMLLPA